MADQIWLGTRKGLFSLEKHGATWQVANAHFLGVQVPMFLPFREKTLSDGLCLLAALKHGHFGSKVQRSLDGGQTWQEVATPTYPEKPADSAEVMDPIRQKPIPWSLEMIWALEHGSNGRLWCGTLPGGLFSSDDWGDSWRLNEPLWNLPNREKWFGGGYDFPGIHSICVHLERSAQITVGVSCGGVWRSDDGGRSWSPRATGMRAEYVPPEQAFDPDIQDPHRLVQCPTANGHHWVQHHNGIFYSDNDCESWKEIDAPEPSAFGFAVAVHPHDPQTAWFVPAIADADRYPKDGKFVVTRTRDGGQSFDVLDNGLPGENAYHLVYRHALEVNHDGSLLVMGSTTGSVWVSEDQGDTWSLVTADLPPVFAVRIAG